MYYLILLICNYSGDGLFTFSQPFWFLLECVTCSHLQNILSSSRIKMKINRVRLIQRVWTTLILVNSNLNNNKISRKDKLIIEEIVVSLILNQIEVTRTADKWIIHLLSLAQDLHKILIRLIELRIISLFWIHCIHIKLHWLNSKWDLMKVKKTF